MNKSDNSLEAIATGSRFLSTTVHEMRTPIQTIISALELLKETSLDTEQLEYIHQMQVGADTLFSLANNILDFSKIRSEGFSLENIDFDLYEIVERVMDSVGAESFDKGLEIVHDFYTSVPRFITGDPTRLQQILLNIVKNSTKFTERGYIHIIVDRPNENTLLFKVEDTGIGIPEESRKKLFTDFYQADTSTTRKYGGTGLGLSICKSLVAAMNGKIGVEQNPQGGSIFWFTIPCVVAAREKLRRNEFAISDIPSNTRILLVDDNFLARKSFDHKLKDFGLPSISLAQSGEEALQKLRTAAAQNKPFTIVFIDMLMPQMDGWRLASKINSDKTINNAKLYLIVPEGQLQQDAKMKMLNWFNGYIYKPIKMQRLSDLLKTAFSVPIELNTEEKLNAALLEKEKGQQNSQIGKTLALVAEDHPVNKKLIVTFLKKLGADVLEADDGEQAVQIAKRTPSLDIVFMDIQMPKLNGLDASCELRKNGYKGVIVACTANHSKEDLERYKESGMNDILAKPYKGNDLRKIILKWKNAFATTFKHNIEEQKERAIENSALDWDASDFEDTVNGDCDFGSQLLLDFIDQTKILIEQIPDYANQGKYEKLRQIGHTLKGSAATVSAFAISRRGSALNKAAHKKSKYEIFAEYNRLKAALRIFSVDVKAWQKEHGIESKQFVENK